MFKLMSRPLATNQGTAFLFPVGNIKQRRRQKELLRHERAYRPRGLSIPFQER